MKSQGTSRKASESATPAKGKQASLHSFFQTPTKTPPLRSLSSSSTLPLPPPSHIVLDTSPSSSPLSSSSILSTTLPPPTINACQPPLRSRVAEEGGEGGAAAVPMHTGEPSSPAHKAHQRTKTETWYRKGAAGRQSAKDEKPRSEPDEWKALLGGLRDKYSKEPKVLEFLDDLEALISDRTGFHDFLSIAIADAEKTLEWLHRAIKTIVESPPDDQPTLIAALRACELPGGKVTRLIPGCKPPPRAVLAGSAYLLLLQVESKGCLQWVIACVGRDKIGGRHGDYFLRDVAGKKYLRKLLGTREIEGNVEMIYFTVEGVDHASAAALGELYLGVAINTWSPGAVKIDPVMRVWIGAAGGGEATRVMWADLEAAKGSGVITREQEDKLDKLYDHNAAASAAYWDANESAEAHAEHGLNISAGKAEMSPEARAAAAQKGAQKKGDNAVSDAKELMGKYLDAVKKSDVDDWETGSAKDVLGHAWALKMCPLQTQAETKWQQQWQKLVECWNSKQYTPEERMKAAEQLTPAIRGAKTDGLLPLRKEYTNVSQELFAAAGPKRSRWG